MSLSPLLVDAKREYTHQLADVLAPYVFNTIARLYERSKKHQPTFREFLRQVPNWNTTSIEERTNEIERRNPQLQDLIAACCVSYTKVLGSIRLSQSQTSNVRVALPQCGVFVHGVYIHVAKEFFYEPKLVCADRHAKTELIRVAVEESVRQHVPIKELLRAYLDVAVDTGGLDPMAIPSAEMYEDPQQQSPPLSPRFEQQQQFQAPQFQQQQPQPQQPQPQQPVYSQPVYMQPVQPVYTAAPVQLQEQFQPQQQQQQPQPQQQQQPQHPQHPQHPQQELQEQFQPQPQPQFLEEVDNEIQGGDARGDVDFE